VEKKVLAHPSSLWRLEGKKWVPEDTSPARMVRQLDQDTKLVLVTPDCIDPAAHPDDFQVYCHNGMLYRDHGGQRVSVAERVIAISTPPL
jgi:hypothetical protein